MAERLAAVPEDSTSGFASPASLPRNFYRDSIRSVAGPEWPIRSTLSSQSGQSGSNYSSESGASSSYMSNISDCCSGSGDFDASELTKIAHRMVSDGYTQRMVQSFKYGGGLETWFVELDVDWVLRNREGTLLRRHLQLEDKSASWLQELVDRWIRALTVMVVSIKELVAAVHEAPLVARFGKASISAMLVFVDAVVHVHEAEKLQAVLHMYTSVSSASYDMCTSTMHLISSEAQSIFNKIGGSLDREANTLIGTISTTMKVVRSRMTLNDDDEDSWATEILQEGGEVHKNIRSLVDCIVSMRKAMASTQNSARSHNTGMLREVISETVNYLKDLLLRKSEQCWDPSLRYLFLLNNSHFVAQASEPSGSLNLELWHGQYLGLKLTAECEKYMDSFLDVSWGHVLSYISKSNFPAPLRRWINSSSLAKFESAFHQTYYQAQKLWKVPDPWLRSLMRETITKRVISGYRDYLKEHPELEKHISGGHSNPDTLEMMLGQLFEG